MLKPYEKYKKTNIPWLEEVPEHWGSGRISSLFFENKNINLNLQEVNSLQFKFGEIIEKKKFELDDELKKTISKYTVVNVDDIVVNGLNLNYDFITKRVARVTKKGIITSAYITMTPRKNVCSKFYTYLFKCVDERKIFNGLGSGIRLTLDYNELKKQYIPIPPRNEQDQIVCYLDRQIGKIDKLVETKKRQIELLKEQKQAVINKAVTKGIDNTAPMKDSGVEWLGEVPVHWDTRFLFQAAKEHYISNKGMVNDNLLSLSYGNIVNKNIDKTDGLLPMSFETYQIVKDGNIILRLTDLQNDHKSLRVGLVTQTGIITSAYTCLTPQNNVISAYIYNLLHSYDICKVFYGMGGGVRQSIGYKDISKIILFLPPIEEQQAIVTHITNITEKIDTVIKETEQEIDLLNEYKTSLISAVVTGRVDVRNHNTKYENR